MNSRFLILGIMLVIIGLSFAVIFYYYFDSAPLTAVGLSTLVLGLTSIFLSGEKNTHSPEAYRMVMMETGVENTTELLEELKIKNKAIYLPRIMRDGHPQALMPLPGDSITQKFTGNLPDSLVIKNLPGSEIAAVAVTTPGNISLDMLPENPGPSADEIQESITYILNRMMEIARKVKVDLTDSRINIEVIGARIDYENNLYYECLGSPIASIAAAVSSEALVKPVRIINESNEKGTRKITLEVLN